LQVLIREVDGFKLALASVTRDLGLPDQPDQLIPLLTEQKFPTDNKKPTKAGFIIETIRKSGKNGITVKEILVAFKEAGISAHDNYPYVIVARLKKEGKVKEAGGRYYLVSEEK
jgi:hypothetical protein